MHSPYPLNVHIATPHEQQFIDTIITTAFEHLARIGKSPAEVQQQFSDVAAKIGIVFDKPAVDTLAQNTTFAQTRSPDWTPAQIELMQKHYPTEGRSILERLEFKGRTPKAIAVKAERLGLKRIKSNEKSAIAAATNPPAPNLPEHEIQIAPAIHKIADPVITPPISADALLADPALLESVVAQIHSILTARKERSGMPWHLLDPLLETRYRQYIGAKDMLTLPEFFGFKLQALHNRIFREKIAAPLSRSGLENRTCRA